MIFKTIDDENSPSGKKIITSFSALSKKNKIDLSKIFDDEFDKKLQTDIASLNGFKDAVGRNMPPLEALQDKMFNASSAAIEFAKTHEAASLNVDEFKVKQKQAQLTLAASNTSFAAVRGIIDDYNNKCATSKLKTEEFISAVSESNKTLGNYLNTVESGSATMSGYVKSLSVAKLKGVGAQLGSIAANMIVSFGLSWGINSIITLFNDWVNAATNASEASKEAAKSALDTAEKHDEEKQSLSDLINQYKELAASGTVEPASREKARDIQKEINSLVGEQVNGLDLVNGRLDVQLQKLKEAAHFAYAVLVFMFFDNLIFDLWLHFLSVSERKSLISSFSISNLLIYLSLLANTYRICASLSNRWIDGGSSPSFVLGRPLLCSSFPAFIMRCLLLYRSTHFLLVYI